MEEARRTRASPPHALARDAARAIQPAFDDHPLIPSSGLWGLPPHDLPDVHAETAEAPTPDIGIPQGSGGGVNATARIGGFADLRAEAYATAGAV
jgi:hypothetical protein